MARLKRGAGLAAVKAAASTDTDKCILYPGATNALGYSLQNYGGQTLAHRATYLYKHGYLPKLLRHSCDTPRCINPKHLLPGTDQDNMNDMVSRNRQCRGDARATILTAQDVRDIRAAHVPGESRWAPGNTRELAAQYGISLSYMQKLVRGEKWQQC